jgi:DNA-binding winged helix-turn-helix (wHTH) protein
MQFKFEPFSLDLVRRQLTRKGTELALTPKAFDLLAVLVHEAPRVVPKAELHQRLWRRTIVSDATLVGLVKEVRRTLGDHDPGARIIRTVHRIGYAFACEVNRISAPALSVSVVHWLVIAGRRFALNEGRNFVGRDASSTVCLQAASVSRHHACISINGDQAVLQDNGSKNGTCVGTRKVAGSIMLRDGDQLAFGSVTGTYRAAGPAVLTVTHRDSSEQ